MAELSLELLAGLDLRVLAIQRSNVGSWWDYHHVISPFSRLWLVLGGRGVVRQQGKQYPLKPGCLHLVPAFTLHECSCSGHLDHYHLHFVARMPTGIDLWSLLDCEVQMPAGSQTARQFQRLERLLPERKLPCYDPAREEYRRFSLMAEQKSGEMAPADWLEARGLLSLLMAPYLRSARRHEGMHARVARQFLPVQHYIHERMHDHILLGDLAKVVGLHPTYFSDRFNELVGLRPLEYLMRRRMERAQYLLLTTRDSVKQVAVEVGIPDAAYFTRAFTKVCGSAPTAFRAAHGVD